MKYGIYYAYWEKEWGADYKKYIKKVSDLDFDILEVGGAPLPDYTPQEADELRKYAEDYGITITTGYGPSPNHNMGSADPGIRQEASEWFKKLFERMAQLNSPLIGGALYSYWPVDFSNISSKEDDWKRSVEGIQLMSELASPYHITLCMEVLNRFENHLLNTAQEGIAFVKEVQCPNVKVMLDTFHMNIEETDMGEAIRSAGSLLGHFHTGECNRMLPGEGRMAWAEIADALKSIHYDGSIVMEPFIKKGGQVGSDIKVWRDLSNGADEAEMDSRARKSVLFERSLFDA